MVFLDYQMPVTDGVEAAKNIKDIITSAKPVVILMTANLLVNDYFFTNPGVVDDFLKKPFTLQEIEALIKKWEPTFAIHPSHKNE
jgi:CheY-like chemotaxis protein